MKRICPHCGKKSKIISDIRAEPKRRAYKLLSKYKCKSCGGHSVRSKNEPSVADNIVISIITLVSGAVLYFVLCEFQTYDVYDIFFTFAVMAFVFLCAYDILGYFDAYCPKKLLPADERDVLYIPKPDAAVAFENQIPKKLKRYDILTAKDETVSLFCVKLDYENNIAECRFLSGGSDRCSKPIDLYINGIFKISCVIKYM